MLLRIADAATDKQCLSLASLRLGTSCYETDDLRCDMYRLLGQDKQVLVIKRCLPLVTQTWGEVV